MMNYNLYHAEDFAADESFVAYCYQTDPKSVAFWTDWIAHHPEKLDEVYNAEQLLNKLGMRLDEHELQAAFDQFDEFLQQETAVATAPKSESKRYILNWSVAAVLLIVCSFGGYQLYQTNFNKLVYTTVHNGNGRVTEFLLSDGTKISLNANSTLTYPRIFKGDTRDVKLDGEAFFEVAKNKDKPFSVLAKGIKTTVLGTKFNVSAYKTNPNLQVALVEGKVEVQTSAGRDRMLLKPMEMVTYNANENGLKRSSFEVAAVTSWRKGIIVFEHASFETIASKLNHIYGIKLLDQTKGLKWNYSGQFVQTDYLTIIKSICFAKKINFKQNKQTFILTN